MSLKPVLTFSAALLAMSAVGYSEEPYARDLRPAYGYNPYQPHFGPVYAANELNGLSGGDHIFRASITALAPETCSACGRIGMHVERRTNREHSLTVAATKLAAATANLRFPADASALSTIQAVNLLQAGSSQGGRDALKNAA